MKEYRVDTPRVFDSENCSGTSAVHELVLQPELFYLCFDVDRPTSKAGFMADELYNQFKGEDPTDEAIIAASDKIDYYKGKMNEKRIS